MTTETTKCATCNGSRQIEAKFLVMPPNTYAYRDQPCPDCASPAVKQGEVRQHSPQCLSFDNVLGRHACDCGVE